MTRFNLLMALGVVALVGCGTLQPAEPVSEQLEPLASGSGSGGSGSGGSGSGGSGKQEFGLTVSISNADQKANIETLYGGKVMVWRPERGFAILGLDAVGAAKVQANPNQGGRKTTLEPNSGKFLGGGRLAWMNGGVSAWAGGGVSAWAGGGVSAWAGGAYAPVPQNTAKWQKLNLQAAHATAINLGAGIKVAIIDSGIDLLHPAFQGALVPAAEMWDYVGNDAVPQEVGVLGLGAFGHGTSVAGIALQMAPKIKILPLRVLGPDGSGDVVNVAAAINRAVQFGAKVINLSLGSDARSPAVSRAIDTATAQGVYVISSSGNTANQSVTFPASEAALDTTTTGLYSLSVGSVNALDQKSGFSTYGTTLEIVAPGEQVYGPIPGRRLGAWTGTSMAAPMVSGAIALALGQNLTALPVDITHKIKSRAVNIYQKGQNLAFQDLLGDGRLDVAGFLNVVMF
jgi:thermitase